MPQQDQSGGIGATRQAISRRSVVRGAAWSVPVIVGASALTPGTAAASTSSTVNLPATIGDGGNNFVSTGVSLTAAGQSLIVSATGNNASNGGGNITQPDGTSALLNPCSSYGGSGATCPISSARIGVLLGRFVYQGAPGPVFEIGARRTLLFGLQNNGTEYNIGTLFVGYNDVNGEYANNSGSYTVTVRKTP